MTAPVSEERAVPRPDLLYAAWRDTVEAVRS
jgi:hypothetical protein